MVTSKQLETFYEHQKKKKPKWFPCDKEAKKYEVRERSS